MYVRTHFVASHAIRNFVLMAEVKSRFYSRKIEMATHTQLMWRDVRLIRDKP
jgi:hypothetical protein